MFIINIKNCKVNTNLNDARSNSIHALFADACFDRLLARAKRLDIALGRRVGDNNWNDR